MSDRVLVDTNILVYAYDADASEKHIKAKAMIDALWDQSSGVLPTQVLAEFFITITRKVKTSPLSGRCEGNNRRLSNGMVCVPDDARDGAIGNRRR
jgi:predicted nucleic acid-binding protein